MDSSVCTIITTDDDIKSVPYEDLCHELGIKPAAGFVQVDEDGRIGFTAGKDWECRALASAVRAHGYVPTPGLADAASGGRPSYW